MAQTETVIEIRQRILPILLYCQANKGDLLSYKQWYKQEDAGKKLFYAYYAGLFCRILCKLESESVFRSFSSHVNKLLDKYNWYNIQREDLELCVSGDVYDCEVADALEYINGVDDVAWKDSVSSNRRDAICLKTEQGTWNFADVRGSIASAI